MYSIKASQNIMIAIQTKCIIINLLTMSNSGILSFNANLKKWICINSHLSHKHTMYPCPNYLYGLDMFKNLVMFIKCNPDKPGKEHASLSQHGSLDRDFLPFSSLFSFTKIINRCTLQCLFRFKEIFESKDNSKHMLTWKTWFWMVTWSNHHLRIRIPIRFRIV